MMPANRSLDKIKIPTAFWEGLRRVGIAPANLIGSAQIPVSAIQDGASVSTAQFFAMWQTLVDISNDPAIGLRLATGLEGAVMPPSFLAAYYARDFRDALQRVARFKRLCAPEEIVINEREEHCDIAVKWTHAEGLAAPPALIDATFASILELGRKGTSAPLVPFSVELARPESARDFYEQYYGCRVRFAAETNLLSFHLADLEKTFASYNTELLDILIPELERRLEQQSHWATLAEQIRWVLRRRLTAGRPDIRSVATELAMSERSLQRKLTEEGLTFQGLLGETRHQLALEYLTDETLTIIEVAYMLGYDDQNSFFRSFRLWEKQTPSAWRAQQRHQARLQPDTESLR